MNATPCSAEIHEAMKLDAAVWPTLKFIGVQILDAFEDEPEERLELRNCACGSTLCKSSAK